VTGVILMMIQIFFYKELENNVILNPAIVIFALFGLLLDIRVMIGSLPFLIGGVFVGVTEFDSNAFIALIPIMLIFATNLAFKQYDVIKSNGYKLIILLIVLILSVFITDYLIYGRDYTSGEITLILT